MTTLVIVRHGRSTANAAGILAGRQPSELDEVGHADARRVGERLTGATVAAVIVSPIVRCQQTADDLIAAAGLDDVPRHTDDRLAECDYGAWTGQKLADLAKEPLWQQVQKNPTSVTFPGGESMQALFDRVIAACDDWNTRLAAADEHAVFVVVTHGDPAAGLIAHYLGMDLDTFQRIAVDPGSVSIVHLGQDAVRVLAVNTLQRPLAPMLKRPETQPEHVVGGGTGAVSATP